MVLYLHFLQVGGSNRCEMLSEDASYSVGREAGRPTKRFGSKSSKIEHSNTPSRPELMLIFQNTLLKFSFACIFHSLLQDEWRKKACKGKSHLWRLFHFLGYTTFFLDTFPHRRRLATTMDSWQNNPTSKNNWPTYLDNISGVKDGQRRMVKRFSSLFFRCSPAKYVN